MSETMSTGRPNRPAGTEELAGEPRPGEHEQHRYDAHDHPMDRVDQDMPLDDQGYDRQEGRPLGADDRVHHAERADHPGDMDGDGHPDRGDLVDRDDPNRDSEFGPEGHMGQEDRLDHDDLDRDRMDHDGDRGLHHPGAVDHHPGAVDHHPGAVDHHPGAVDPAATSLFGEADVEGFRARWMQLQAMFVDEPRAAVQQADQLVAEVMQNLAAMFANNKHELEGQWQREGAADTEDLRQALRRYRTFFDQLIGRH